MCRGLYNENNYCLQRALKFAHKFVSYNYRNTHKLHPQQLVPLCLETQRVLRVVQTELLEYYADKIFVSEI
jgi:hypothetical protein